MIETPKTLRKFLGVISAAATLSALAACQADVEQATTGSTTVDTAAVQAAIDTLRNAYEQAVATGNFSNMGAMLAEGAVMVPPGGAQWDSLFASSDLPWPPGATIDITPIETRVLNHQWAYEFGNAVVKYTPKGATAAQSLKDTYLIIFHNTGDGWKVFREVASSNVPKARQ